MKSMTSWFRLVTWCSAMPHPLEHSRACPKTHPPPEVRRRPRPDPRITPATTQVMPSPVSIHASVRASERPASSPGLHWCSATEPPNAFPPIAPTIGSLRRAYTAPCQDYSHIMPRFRPAPISELGSKPHPRVPRYPAPC